MTKDISIETYHQQFKEGDDFLLIDVREIEEFEEIRIPYAVNIPISEFQDRIDEVPEDKPIVLVCRSGNRSAMVGDFLSANGYENVYNLLEGMVGWMRRGHEATEG